MKIVYVITGLTFGGAEKQLLNLATNFQQLGHNVHVIAMKGGALQADFINAGIPLTVLNISGLRSGINGIAKTIRLIKEINPDAVHSHMVHANIFARILRLLVPMKRLVCTAHNINEGGSLRMLGYRITDKLADMSTNVSEEALNHYIDIKAFNKERSVHVPNAIDTNYFQPKEVDRAQLNTEFNFAQDTFIFLAVGRLHEQKDYPVLLQAFSDIVKDKRSVGLLIVGEGQLEEILKDTCRDLGIDSYVRFLGRRDDIDVLMNYSNCFVLTSKFEGFGLVVAEAMAVGTPVIATDCGGVKEVMGGNGVLVPVGSVPDLVLNMKKAREGVLFTHEDGVTSRAHIQRKYSLDAIIKIWLSIYKGNA